MAYKLGIILLCFYPLLASADPLQEVTRENWEDWSDKKNTSIYIAFSANDLKKADALGREWLHTGHAIWGEHHFKTGQALMWLAAISRDSGRIDEAKTHYEQLEGVWCSSENGPINSAHEKCGWAKNSLAKFHAYIGDFNQAREWFHKADKSWTAAFPVESVDALEKKAFIKNNMANILKTTSQVQKSIEEYEEVLQIYSAIFNITGKEERNDENQHLSNCLKELESEKNKQDKPKSKKEKAAEARLIKHKHLRAERAVTLNQLANAYFKTDQIDKGLKYLQEAAEDVEWAHGNGHPHYMTRMAQLGDIWRIKNDLDLAKKHLACAEHQRKRMRLPINKPEAQIIDEFWVNFFASIGETDKALERLEAIIKLQENRLKTLLNTGSDQQKRDYMRKAQTTVDQAISLHIDFGEESEKLAHFALEVALQRKGRVIDIQTGSYNTIRNSGESASQQLNALLDSYEKLAILQSTKAPQNPDTQKKLATEIKELTHKINETEESLAAQSSAYKKEFDKISIDAIRKELPSDSLLIEFMAYQPIGTLEAPNPARKYVVYTLDSTGKIKWADLGEADPIDMKIRWLVGALGKPPPLGEDTIQRESQSLFSTLLGPLCGPLEGRSHLVIAPDGVLSLLNFEVLAPSNGTHLIDQVQISYLTSGRDLLRLRDRSNNTEGPVLFGNATYDLDPIWDNLPGTKAEIQNIGRILKHTNPRLFSEAKANEENLRAIKGPVLLHTAIHGAFEEQYRYSQEQSEEESMFTSALVLSGSHSGGEPSNDGYLYAHEATRLDLNGTRLVTLSACGTGSGKATNGEGIYGLRRSFVLAGSETILTSLWKVSDESAPALMEHYYSALVKGHGRSSALRHAKLQLRKTPEWDAPYHWAAFVSNGAWDKIPELQKRKRWRRTQTKHPHAVGLSCSNP